MAEQVDLPGGEGRGRSSAALSGFDRLVDVVLTNADHLRDAVASIDGLGVLGNPTGHLFALATDETVANPVPIRPLGAAMRSRGWVHELQHDPKSLHVTLSNVNAIAVDRGPDDLAASVADVPACGFDATSGGVGSGSVTLASCRNAASRVR